MIKTTKKVADTKPASAKANTATSKSKSSKAKTPAVNAAESKKAAPKKITAPAPKAKAPIGKRTQDPTAKSKARPDASAVLAVAEQASDRKMSSAPAPKPAPKVEREQTHQINFKASTTMARLIADLSRDDGVRVLFAKLLQKEGHDIPEQDLQRHEFKRRF